MLGRGYETQVCSISRTLEVFGERWTFLIMRNALFADSTRFVEFQRSLGIATNVLATRLEHLVGAGVMERLAEGGDESPRYRLTARGRELAPALIALTEWGDRWAAPAGEPVLYRHHGGEHPVRMRLVCEECGVLDDADDVEALPGPGMPEEQAARLLQRHRMRHAG
ncbi:winged helix-turn-helix transcriptional regulator [Protaetiibacter mangrovi]|uniref:Helix-turn-helix transcriptional regulator n=1 Tax=Protaetiibacter mangrovi TaxID=2970926 RepID=A0ABT1ZEI5_9MICO|nr:helix-turn-helix domain-containing protein [Protaetiibacter mangrovi]MCS0499117.1 helix-turn-helix transcriptional regulator [Protaetiibacter mangrovi]TPX02817.1 helix-turn-helix transcriptional regulator [Schumannella luteola]